MAKETEMEKSQNMANFIKKQSAELLYQLKQLSATVDVSLIQQVENLCESAETVRKSRAISRLRLVEPYFGKSNNTYPTEH